MSKEVNIFEATSFNSLKERGFVITKKERVVFDYFIELDGIKFDAEDLYETLSEVTCSDIVVTYERSKLEVLKKLGILKSEGNSRWCVGASLGDNGEEFLEILRNKLRED